MVDPEPSNRTRPVENPMLTLAPPSTHRRSRPANSQTAARSAQKSAVTAESAAPVLIRTSSLEAVMVALAGAHARHAAGPIFPCPLCFVPRLGGGAL
jgi:hypothetical protein